MKQYYFVNSQGQQMGPVPMEELKNQNIQRNTPVWCEGMTDWTEAGTGIPVCIRPDLRLRTGRLFAGQLWKCASAESGL